MAESKEELLGYQLVDHRTLCSFVVLKQDVTLMASVALHETDGTVDERYNGKWTRASSSE